MTATAVSNPGADRRHRRARPGHLVLLLMLAVLGTACEVRTEVDVRVDEDGGGVVVVSVLLDEEAAAKVPDLASQLRTEDLEATGWKVTGPNPAGGGLRITAEKRFAGPDQLGSVMTELTGPDGPFRDFKIEREHSFGETSYRIRGVVDLGRGLEVFGDQKLREALGGPMFGRPVEVLELEAGRPLAEAAPFKVTVHLPGGERRSVEPVLGGEPVQVRAESTVRSRSAVLLAGGAAFVGVLAIVLFLLIASRRIGPRRRGRAGAQSARPYRGLHRIDDDDLYEPPIIRPG